MVAVSSLMLECWMQKVIWIKSFYVRQSVFLFQTNDNNLQIMLWPYMMYAKICNNLCRTNIIQDHHQYTTNLNSCKKDSSKLLLI
jgi:hypothetical protein